jgi:hypothetical protein
VTCCDWQRTWVHPHKRDAVLHNRTTYNSSVNILRAALWSVRQCYLDEEYVELSRQHQQQRQQCSSSS